MLKDGEVSEFDTPLSLLKNTCSEFFQMVEKTGKDNARKLFQMATEAHTSKEHSSDIAFVTSV